MGIVRSKLYESPDNFRNLENGEYIEWDSTQYGPVVFGFYEDKLYWSDLIISRSGPESRALVDEYGIEPDAYGMKDYRGLTHSELSKIHGLTNGYNSSLSRFDWKNAGRLWKNAKVISFWSYPNKSEMPKVLKTLQDEIGINILKDPEWKIEIYSKEGDHSGWIFIPVTDYVGSDKLNPSELAKRHVMSPLLKKPNNSAAAKYHKKPKYANPKWKNAHVIGDNKNEIVRNRLYENPDGLEYNGKPIKHYDNNLEPIPFGYYEDNLYVGVIGGIHGQIPELEEITNMIRQRTGEYTTTRQIMGVSGRLWKVPKLISFWIYPTKEEFPKVIKEIGEKIDEPNMFDDPEWKVEVITGRKPDYYKEDKKDWSNYNVETEFITFKDYVGSNERSAKELATQHVMSPMLKKPVGSAAAKYHKKKTPYMWRQAHIIGDNKNEIVRPSINE